MGRFSVAEEIFQRTAAELENRDEYTSAGPSNLLYVSSCGWRAFSLAELGDFDAAHASAGRAMRGANASGFAYSQAIANTMSGLAWWAQGHLDRAAPLLETALRLCREYHLAVWVPIPSSLLGHAYTLLGDQERGLVLLEDAVAKTEALGINAYRALWHVNLADGLRAAGRWIRARELAYGALEMSQRFKETGNHARALVVIGETSLCGGDDDLARAEDSLQHGLAEAEELRMRPLVARCYVALSRLAAAAGDQEHAAAHLATATALASSLGLQLPVFSPPPPATVEPRAAAS
jgi:ATP/maltotriose-dependent transcriptional regulator MalT